MFLIEVYALIPLEKFLKLSLLEVSHFQINGNAAYKWALELVR